MQCSICGHDLTFFEYKGAKFGFCKSCNSVHIKLEELQKALAGYNIGKTINAVKEMLSATVNEDKHSCYNCHFDMDKILLDGVIIDRCNNCNVVVFEDGELAKFFKNFLSGVEICSNLQFIKKHFDELKNEEIKMSNENRINNTQNYLNNPQLSSIKEKIAPNMNGFLALFVMAPIFVIALLFFTMNSIFWIVVAVIIMFIEFFALKGFKTIKPQEAVVYTIFGNYYGSIKEPGFFWVNPFANPVGAYMDSSISLKVRTLDSGAQKINDELGNPIQVGIIVTWQVVDTAKALFGVDNYNAFLASQSDAALRSIIRLYPYDAPNDSNVHSLRGDSEEISEKLKIEIQKNVAFAGIKIIMAKISHLAYAPEIAAAMLQRQQANAVLDAKKAIVDGSVDMVTMALDKLASSNVQLDEKTKANMVNNLLVALCSNKDNQPVTRLDVI